MIILIIIVLPSFFTYFKIVYQVVKETNIVGHL